MNDELFKEILGEAYIRYKNYSCGVRGQIIRKEDGLDYWVAEVAWEWAQDSDKIIK